MTSPAPPPSIDRDSHNFMLLATFLFSNKSISNRKPLTGGIAESGERSDSRDKLSSGIRTVSSVVLFTIVIIMTYVLKC